MSRRKTKPLVYVAGPFSGAEFENVHKAVQAAETIYNIGASVLLPHTMTAFWHLIYPKPVEEWYDIDKQLLLACDAVYRVAGKSVGADSEVQTAKSIGIPVFHSFTDLSRFIDYWRREHGATILEEEQDERQGKMF